MQLLSFFRSPGRHAISTVYPEAGPKLRKKVNAEASQQLKALMIWLFVRSRNSTCSVVKSNIAIPLHQTTFASRYRLRLLCGDNVVKCFGAIKTFEYALALEPNNIEYLLDAISTVYPELIRINNIRRCNYWSFRFFLQ